MGLADTGDRESEGFLDLGAAWDGGSWKVLDEDFGPVDPRTLERTGMEGFMFEFTVEGDICLEDTMKMSIRL